VLLSFKSCRLLLLAFSGLIIAACAVNPATGKRQLVLVSEQQEIQLGLENDRAVTAQLGLYPDEELQAYVQRLGTEIAAKSERPNLDWQFRVVDDPVVNAFALPGGFIYITRGILAHFNNEAELASVIGHEIGHVTARHSVNQMSKAQLAQLGMVGGMIFAPERMQRFGQWAETGLGLMFLKFSRDDERQADDLGLRYLLYGGYDPRPMPDVFDTLGRVGAAHGGERLPGWMSTHPYPENRRERINSQIAAAGEDFSGRPVRRDEYLARIDDILFGEDPQQGYFKDGLFLHPQMQFQLRFPAGWKTANQRQAVVGISPEQDAIVQLSLAAEATASEAHQKFFSQEGLRRADHPVRMTGGLHTVGSGFSVETQQGQIQGLAAFVEHGGKVFQLLAYTNQTLWPDRGPALESSATSFDRLQDRRALDARPKRLDVVTVSTSMGFPEFARLYDATVEPETLALINGMEPDGQLQAGLRYKIVTGGYTP
jgi:predicted Zn-dependent protease